MGTLNFFYQLRAHRYKKMKLLILSALSLVLARNLERTKSEANKFLAVSKRVRRANYVFDTPWEAAKDQLEEQESRWSKEGLEILKECTETYDENYENWDEVTEEYKETGATTGSMPAKPVYNCHIDGIKIDLAQYAGQETF